MRGPPSAECFSYITSDLIHIEKIWQELDEKIEVGSFGEK